MTDAQLAAVVRGLAPVVREYVTKAVADCVARLTVHEAQLGSAAQLTKDLSGLALEVTKDLGAMRERLAVLETKAPMPGPPGADGKDGLGFEDLSVDFDGERGLALKFARGTETKVFHVALPYLKYQGVWEAGHTYAAGDVVTWGGSTWHAKAETSTKPGEVVGAAHWTLCVKKGRDGRDGKDAPGALPVVKR